MALTSSRATPFVYLPCSQTPVVSASLALSLSGRLPYARCTASAFPLTAEVIDHDYTDFGVQSHGLHTRLSCSAPPLLVGH